MQPAGSLVVVVKVKVIVIVKSGGQCLAWGGVL